MVGAFGHYHEASLRHWFRCIYVQLVPESHVKSTRYH
jgi:hypothetical protein